MFERRWSRDDDFKLEESGISLTESRSIMLVKEAFKTSLHDHDQQIDLIFRKEKIFMKSGLLLNTLTLISPWSILNANHLFLSLWLKFSIESRSDQNKHQQRTTAKLLCHQQPSYTCANRDILPTSAVWIIIRRSTHYSHLAIFVILTLLASVVDTCLCKKVRRFCHDFFSHQLLLTSSNCTSVRFWFVKLFLIFIIGSFLRY